MGKIIFDSNGIQLANVPNAGVARKDPNAASGNPNHDVRSGKFGDGSSKKQVKPPANVDPLAYARMMDAVRDAAREFDDPKEGDIREFIKGRATAPEAVDIAAFYAAVQEQRLSDLVDMLDQSMRSGGPMKRGRRKVRLSAPKGYMRKMIGKMDSDNLAQLMHRLEGMGHDRDEVEKFLGGRASAIDDAKPKRDAISASDQEWLLPEPIDDAEEDDDRYEPVFNFFITGDGDVAETAKRVASELGSLADSR